MMQQAVLPQPAAPAVNPFANAAPAAPAGPPGGQQDIGEFGPYYIYQGDTLVEVPAVNVVRDYDYAYKITETDLRTIVAQGWCNSFESSAILSVRPLKSRSIVVMSNNGWMSGDKTRYTWCIRIDVQVETAAVGTLEDTVSGEPKELQHFGRHVLWPIAPERASNARERWKEDETLRESRLVQQYVPCCDPFCYTSIPWHSPVSTVSLSTLQLLESVKPVSVPSRSHCSDSRDPLVQFEWPDNDSLALPRDPCWQSKVVSRGMAHRAAQCMNITTFTARDDIGWPQLEDDTAEYIWERLAEEALDTHGGCTSNSLRTWCTLRRVSRQSKRIVENLTKKFVQHASMTILAWRKSLSVADAIASRNLLVPRGINPHALQLELTHAITVKMDAPDSLWATVAPYIRIRTGKPPTDNPPAPVRRRAEYKLAVCKGRTWTVAPAAMSVPEPKPERSSMRLGLKRSTTTRAGSSTSNANPFPANYSVIPPTWKAITFKLALPAEEPEKPAAKARRIAPPPKSPVLPESPEKTMLGSWVCCDACDKWRRIEAAPGLTDYLSVQDLPKHWFCDMHPSGITCEDAEEGMEQSEVTNASFGGEESPQEAKRFKPSSRTPNTLRPGLRRVRPTVNGRME